MANHETLVRPDGMRRAFDTLLLGGVSLLALMSISDLGLARSLTPGSNTVAPTVEAQQAAIAAAQQAAGAAAQAQASLARARAALDAARKLQLDAAAAARASQSNIPNGVQAGGLDPLNSTGSSTVTKDKVTTTTWQTDPSWINANGPIQTTKEGSSKVTVDITQTQSKAILNWKTFNVGADTTVNFNQTSSDWIAMNRVLDPIAAPSRILGQINAPGSVYIINRNGIVFGAGSQVNVHSLVASSLDIGQLGSDLTARNQYFLNTGIANLNSFSIYDEAGGARTNLIAGDVTVERGASITADIAKDIVPLGSPGSVYLFGGNVHNSGTITTPTGEIAMVAARTIDLVPNGYSKLPDDVLAKDSSGNLLKFRGIEFRISQFDTSYDVNGYSNGLSRYLTGTGAVTHDGLIEASRGIVVMNGDRISIDNPTDANGAALKDAGGNLVQGVISVDTSVTRNSMVLLRAATSVTMNGLISSRPVDDGSTLPSGTSSGSTVQSFTPAYVEMTAQSTVEVGSSGLVYAPSAHVSLGALEIKGTAAGTGTSAVQNLFNQGGNSDVSSNTPQAAQAVLLAPGATIDVAGLQNVAMEAGYNVVDFAPRAEFADMPLQRIGPLYGQTMWIDIRASGTRSDGTKWVGTPLADASGYVSNVPRRIDQLMTVGGTVDLKTDLNTNNGGGTVRTEGSVINVAGGSVQFKPDMVKSTRLLGADGRMYNMANADPNMTYLGLAGTFTRDHSRWGVKEVWSTSTEIFSPGYTEGHNAGKIDVTAVTPVLTGTMYFGSVAGERQIAGGLLPLQGTLALTTPSSVQIGPGASTNYTTQSPTTALSADTLSGYGLSALTVTANDLVVSNGSSLNLAAGGSFSVTANAIDVSGTVSAAGGSINLVTDRIAVREKFGNLLFKAPKEQSGVEMAANVFVDGVLDVSGRFVNDTGRAGSDVSGSAYINGGSISIVTYKDSGDGRDLTGSILLAKDSVLDASSGGYISAQAKPKTTSTGTMAGKGGSISLAIYQGTPWRDNGELPTRPVAGVSNVAVLQLDGAMRAYGFESNGSLRLAGADTIRIGGTLQQGETSSIRIGGVPSTLPTSLLTGGGFGAYTIEAVTDDWSGATANIVVSAGTQLNLQQRNLSSVFDYSGMGTGTKLGQQAAPALDLLPDDQRKAIDLTLRADNILLDTGSKIVTDPKATIAFGAVNAIRTSTTSGAIRNVPAQNVEMRGSIVNHGGTVFVNALRTRLGSEALIDLSGTFVANSYFGTVNGPMTSGTYLAGGKFVVEAGEATATKFGGTVYRAPASNSYLVAESGARVDVSGVAGYVGVAGARGKSSSTWWWTDAGKVSANVSGFAWGGSFAATGGRYVGANGTTQVESRANGGTFMLGGGAISLRQDTTDAGAAVAAFNGGRGSAPSSLFVAADQLGQFDNVYLYAGGALGGATRIFSDQPGIIYGSEFAIPPSYSSLTITGSLDWNVTNRLALAAGTITTSSPVDAKLSAGYVMLTGGGGTAQAGSSTLTVKGRAIDVEGATFSRFSQVNLLSSGDLRLSTPRVVNGIIPTGSTTPTERSTFTGRMASAGDLLLSAQRIYPVSAVDFTIETPGNVTFAAPAGSKTSIPLSAGGGVTVYAKNIVQGGNLFAPLGRITLGSTDPAVSAIKTQSVTLVPGSLTSVTLADTVVPYGATGDGTSWYYNASDALAQPPSKGIVLAGSDVTRADGSTIDLRGGGDIQAMEWIQGKGGSRDTLTTTPSGQTVYALLPSGSDPIAAFDIHLTAPRSQDGGQSVIAGDTYPLAGTQITIAGGNGIAGGTYTLYPAHYATLPGAMRVVDYGSNLGRNIPTGTRLPDGTTLVTGNYALSAVSGKQSAGETVFAVQTSAVWQQYSEYSLARANSYYTELAAKQDRVVPRLPVDAGRLAVSALQSIVLNGIALTQPGKDSNGNTGRGGELDISAPKLAVIGHAGYLANDIPSGYVGLDVTQLNGFESILIGGLRSDTVNGTLITPNANNVLVDTRGETFSAPEILLVAQAAKPTELQTVPQTVTVNGQTIAVEDQVLAPASDTGTVRVAAGSVIKTTGQVNAGAGRQYYFADPTPDSSGATSTAQDIAAALGGTLDASGTVITGADIAKFNYSIRNADGSIKTNPDGSIYRHTGTLSAADLNKLQNYAYQSKGLNALFVATNDSSLKISGPSKLAPPSLTIKFAASADPNASGPTNGVLVLPDAGRVQIDSGVNITTKALTLHATATSNSIVGNSSDLHLGQLNISARTIGLGSSTIVGDKSVALYNQQFSDVQAMSLKALSGVITVYGDFNPGAVGKLTLDASAIVRADNGVSANVSVNGAGSSITLVNTGSASASAASPGTGGANLNFDASEIVLGGGSQNILGYEQVNLRATDRVFVAGKGDLKLGAGSEAVDLNIATPKVLVASDTSAGSGSFAVSTLGRIVVSDFTPGNTVADRPADSAETGGSLSLTASSIIVASTIQAQAGTITLEATTGDVSLAPRAYLSAAGYKKTLVDVDTYLSGGKVVLKANAGNVWTDALSVIDVAQPAGGLGYGGDIEVTALNGNATLGGMLRGAGGVGLGGSFKLDTKGAADLTALADRLLGAGLTGAVDIHTRTGNLELKENHTLKANSVTLTADDANWGGDASQQFGKVLIAGRIDATGYGGKTLNGDGQAGGKVAIYGANEVLLASSGVIDASTTHTNERGGDVTVGIGWSAKSKLFLQQGTQINVSGGTKGGLSGGTVTLRAPRDGNNDVKIAALSNVRNANGTFDELPFIDATNNVNDRSKIGIIGARSVAVNGFISFDTTASDKGIDGSALGWNGTIDPAGWYNPDGSVATNGSWTNVSGWQVSGITGGTAVTAVPPDATVTVIGANGGATNIKVSAIMGLSLPPAFPPRPVQVDVPPGSLAPNTTYTLTFDKPPGGVAGQATISTDANGQVIANSFTITNRGSGYTTVPVSATVNGLNLTATLGNLRMTVVSAELAKTNGVLILDPNGKTISETSTLTASFGAATVNFSLGSGFSGRVNNGVFAADTSYIALTSSGVYSTFDPTKPGTASFAGDTAGRNFLANTVSQVTQGTWTYNNQNYGFGNLFTRLQPLVDSLGSNVVHVQPGVELINSTGNITVAANWNLASGTAGNLQTATRNGQTFQYFDPASSYINFNYRLATPWGGLDAGALTLRARDNINVNASISDGFFQFGNTLDPNYVSAVAAYLAASPTDRTIDQAAGQYAYFLNNGGVVPIAPYQAAGNSLSPTARDMATADLFPHALRVCTVDCSAANIKTITSPSSWSYAFTAGADTASANPMARVSLSGAQAGNKGDVIVNNHASYSQVVNNNASGEALTGNARTVTVNLPTMIRTGTGNISISAARDVRFADTVAPGVIYAAGVNTAKLADANYSAQTNAGVSRIVAGNPDGFYEPQILAYGNRANVDFGASELYYGPPTAAAFPEKGGDVVIDAQRDIVGYDGSGNKVVQYYQPWLLSNAGVTPAGSALTGGSVKLFGAGVFMPSQTQIASQTAWWIQYGSFQQGILSAGGNVTVKAGRDLIDVSVSLPTTGRVSGGLSATSTPVTYIYDSGNMLVRAGRDIRGGSFYQGSGHASISAAGSIGQNGTVSRFASSKLLLPDVPLLAVDTGQIEMVAGRSIAMAGVVNPAELHAQQPNFANPLDLGANGSAVLPLYMNTYGPDSAVRLVAREGDLSITIAPTAIADRTKGGGTSLPAAAALYPASFEALALNGSLLTSGISEITRSNTQTGLIGSTIPMPGIVLNQSEHGKFNLLAQGSIDLTFGYPNTTTLLDGTPRPFISAGPALIETGFDPYQPNAGFGGAFNGALLAHQNDTSMGLDTKARIYAVSGDIKATGGFGRRTASSPPNEKVYQHIEINRPLSVYAGRDIVDLNLIVQNIQRSDVSTIQAGRNITYTGFNNGGGLQVSGPGFFLVQAGGDIGPFVPAAHNNAVEAQVQEGIVSVGNATPTPVGNVYVSSSIAGGGSTGIYNQSLLGPYGSANPRRNALLTAAAGTTQGADIITMFGTKFGVDYESVVEQYIRPNPPGTPPKQDQNYIPLLRSFLDRIGKPISPLADEAAVFAAFKVLPADLQHVFVDQVFFNELYAVSIAQKNGISFDEIGTRAYKAINTMFPSEWGYTENSLDYRIKPSQLVRTGDLDLRHATIQSQLGGNVIMFGPGGNIIAGSLATESNTALELRDVGILTLGGGVIATFTDQSVLVNSSRVLTTQGGEILMFSANRDLDAGRGSKTTLSAPALQVLFDQDAYQSIDLGGFVTGAGIATLQASSVAQKSPVLVTAPRGQIDFGTAGVRSSGDLVAFAPVIVNASNAQVGGSTTGVPTISMPNVGALTAGSNTAGAAAKSETPTAGGGNQERASIFIVEVIGYGGGGQDQSPADDKRKPDDEKEKRGE